VYYTGIGVIGGRFGARPNWTYIPIKQAFEEGKISGGQGRGSSKGRGEKVRKCTVVYFVQSSRCAGRIPEGKEVQGRKSKRQRELTLWPGQEQNWAFEKKREPGPKGDSVAGKHIKRPYDLGR